MKQKLTTGFQTILVAAILVALPIGAGALVPKAPLISLGDSQNSAMAGSEQGSDSKMMMPNPFTYNYVAGSSLPTQSGTGHVYQLQLIGTAEQILQNVAKVMKLDGQVLEAEYSTKEYPAFLIGPQDGSGPSASIYFNGTGNWWYNNPAAYPMPECIEWASAEDGSKYCQLYEEQKTTPELLPSNSEMLEIAQQIFSATGLTVDESEIRLSTYDWGSSAYASLKVGNQDSPIEWSVNWGSNGQIGSISGHSVKAIDRGEFKTISPSQAVARMSDWRYSGQLSQSAWNKYQPEGGRAIAYDDMMVEPADPDAATKSESDQPESEQPESAPSPSTITVTVNKFESSPVMIWDKQGNAWIVPGYVLLGDESWITPVFSLEDGVVELPEPVEVSPMLK